MYSCAREAHQHSGVRARGAPTHHLELGNFGARLGVCACLQPRAGTTDFSRAARARRRGQHAAKRGSAEGDQHVRYGAGAALGSLTHMGVVRLRLRFRLRLRLRLGFFRPCRTKRC